MIIDDEEIAIKIIEKLVSDYPQLKMVRSLSNPRNILEEIETYSPDLIFLDINLGNVSGIALGEKISEMHPHVKIVFVTAYSEYAIQAFEMNALDYLLKPVSRQRFKKMMKRVLDSEEKEISATPKITLNVFLDAQIKKENGEILKLRTRKASELLFLLWVNQESGLSKDDIMESLWPDQTLDTSTMMLHTTIYQIRQVFKKEYQYNPIVYKGGKYFLNGEFDSELSTVESILSLTPSQEGVQELLTHYRGKLFEKSDYAWSYRRSKILHHQVVEYLIQALESGLVTLSNYHKIMTVFEEDILATEQYVDLVYTYLKNINESQQAKLFKNRAIEYLEKELGVYM